MLLEIAMSMGRTAIVANPKTQAIYVIKIEGTLDCDFLFESNPPGVFLLGKITVYRLSNHNVIPLTTVREAKVQ